MPRRWPNLNLIISTYLNASLDARVVTVLPSDLEGQVVEHGGVVRVTRGPGSDDSISDSTLVDVETFTLNESTGWPLAEDARQALHALAGRSVGGALVDTVNTSQSPVYLDYGNDAVWRTVASYRVELRKITVE